MIDLCVGPHIPHTGKIKALMVTKVCRKDRYVKTTKLMVFEVVRIVLVERRQQRLVATDLWNLLP